jgi:hypothetical protein
MDRIALSSQGVALDCRALAPFGAIWRMRCAAATAVIQYDAWCLYSIGSYARGPRGPQAAVQLDIVERY